MKRVIIAGAAGIAAVAAVTASAASLGGFTGQDVGADATIVASCQDANINVEYTQVYDSDDSAYVVTEVVFSPVSANCNSLPYQMTLAASDGSAIPGGTKDDTTVVVGNEFTVTLDDSILAESIYNVALVISSNV